MYFLPGANFKCFEVDNIKIFVYCQLLWASAFFMPQLSSVGLLVPLPFPELLLGQLNTTPIMHLKIYKELFLPGVSFRFWNSIDNFLSLLFKITTVMPSFSLENKVQHLFCQVLCNFFSAYGISDLWEKIFTFFADMFKKKSKSPSFI